MPKYYLEWKERYLDWNQQAAFMPECHMWYKTSNLIYYLHHLRHFIIKEEGSFLALHHEPIPATEFVRFPDDGSYMCEGIGDWNIHLDMILLCLNILLEVKPVEESCFQNLIDVELKMLEKVNVLLQCTTQEHNLMTRQKFEAMYKLTWGEYPALDYKSMPVVVVYFAERVDLVCRTVVRYKHRFLMWH
ncbi:hypothetical protein INT47_005741 [Mucor saturninus]|uniref:Uncharacterized protein n=1 Tax=Mucor saturninus TaxID=64648 RepID=A0A8H7QKX8_9FUNG|nr:hypothetical protein INT47_005741 [Mucor saturninus]